MIDEVLSRSWGMGESHAVHVRWRSKVAARAIPDHGTSGMPIG